MCCQLATKAEQHPKRVFNSRHKECCCCDLRDCTPRQERDIKPTVAAGAAIAAAVAEM